MNRARGRRGDFFRAHPEGFFVDPTLPEALERYARERGFLGPDEVLVSVSKAGEGNMNLTLRLATDRKSVVLKQARPWVEKYPAIDAPAGRASVELAFYRTVSSHPSLKRAMPRVLGDDESSGILVLEDLGDTQDFTSLYRGARLSDAEADALSSYLVALHSLDCGSDLSARSLLRNREMRALNHEHIFRLPLAADNGLALDDITPGLSDAADRLRRNERYRERARELGALYLADGPTLVHGDYFPGSWLRTADGVKVIDPEFGFLGTAAFDLGVLLAHLHLSRQPPGLGESLLGSYRERSRSSPELVALARRLAGIEIMRRLIGVAQLPALDATLEEKTDWLALSRALVLS